MHQEKIAQWNVLSWLLMGIHLCTIHIFAPQTLMEPPPKQKKPYHINKVNSYVDNLKAKHHLHILIHDTSELPTSFIQNTLLLRLSSNNKTILINADRFWLNWKTLSWNQMNKLVDI